MGYPVLKIEGIGPVLGAKFKKAGVSNTDQLLEKAKDPKGRKALASETGIDEGKVLKFANMSDLMRIKGVGEEFSELLEAAGVDTVKELKTRNVANLTKAMEDANSAKKMVRRTPSFKEVEKWVEQAKKLAPVLTY